jgi:S-disulfanyl-L-cysteine oxidoreductase SoxD
MGPLKMRSLTASLVAALMILAVSATLQAQGKDYKLGRAPTAEEVQAWDISIGPTGRELPPGSGTAKDGAEIFAEKCVVCHGENGEGSKLAPRLLREKGDPGVGKTIGNYAPFATSIWDYINRAMPRLQGGSLKPDEVYSLTAFLLFRTGGIVKEDTVLDAKSLPKIEMPNRNGFVPGPWPTYPYPKQRPFGLYP